MLTEKSLGIFNFRIHHALFEICLAKKKKEKEVRSKKDEQNQLFLYLLVLTLLM